MNNNLVYCKDCKSTNTWERHPAKDWVFESGIIFEYAYKCRICGAIALYPNEVITSSHQSQFLKATTS